MRVSTNKQDFEIQHYEFLQSCDRHSLQIDEWIEVTAPSRRSQLLRKLDDLDKLQVEDILIVSELSRLGRSMTEVSSSFANWVNVR